MKFLFVSFLSFVLAANAGWDCDQRCPGYNACMKQNANSRLLIETEDPSMIEDANGNATWPIRHSTSSAVSVSSSSNLRGSDTVSHRKLESLLEFQLRLFWEEGACVSNPLCFLCRYDLNVIGMILTMSLVAFSILLINSGRRSGESANGVCVVKAIRALLMIILSLTSVRDPLNRSFFTDPSLVLAEERSCPILSRNSVGQERASMLINYNLVAMICTLTIKVATFKSLLVLTRLILPNYTPMEFHTSVWTIITTQSVMK